MAQEWILQIDSTSEGAREVVLKPGEYALGRGSDCPIRLNEPEVSRHHARLIWEDSRFRVMDLGSANGTFVNGEKLPVKSWRLLNEEDVIRIGRIRLTLTARSRNSGSVSSDEEAPTAFYTPPEVPKITLITSTETKEIPLERMAYRIGRAPDNDITVPENEVSAHHARIVFDGEGCEIEDLGSTNGTYFRGKRVSRCRLEDREEVRFGPKVLVRFIAGERESRDAESVRDVSIRALLTGGKTQHRIGRGDDNDTVLKHPLVSRHHARLIREGGTIYIEDSGSLNGTFVNGERITEKRRLQAGDRIRIHPFLFTFHGEGLAQDIEVGSVRLDAYHLSRMVGDGVKILQDVSLSIQPGELVAVVGGSGCGKSTLINALSGFGPATEGTVYLNEYDLYERFDDCRSLIGYVPQDDIIHLDLTVSRALDYAAQLTLPPDTTKQERRDRLKEVLHHLGLWERRNTRVKKLSGGQRKRVSIGVELLPDPSLFFLDEPTSGLDPGTELTMMKLMRSLADNQSTVVFTTHTTENIMMCDKVVFMAEGGCLVFFGRPEEALKFFEVEQFISIYEKLNDSDSTEEWRERYRRSEFYHMNIVRPLETRHAPPPETSIRKGDRPRKFRKVSSGKPRPLKQFSILTRRYLDLILSNPANLVVMILQAPVAGLLVVWLFGPDIFDPTPWKLGQQGPGNGRLALIMVYNLTLLTCYYGLSNAAKEIIKESPVYRRERLANLQIGPYISSKFVVLLFICIVQCVTLLAVTAWGIELPPKGPGMILRMLVTLVLTGMAGTALGLFVSSVVRSEDTAVSLVPILLVPNLMFAGTIMAYPRMMPIAQCISLVSISKWGLEALGTIVDLNGLFESQGGYMLLMMKEYEDSFEGNVVTNWVVLVFFILLPLAGTYIAQKRKDLL